MIFLQGGPKFEVTPLDRAMRPMYGHPEHFPESLTTPTATFPEFLMGFCSD